MTDNPTPPSGLPEVPSDDRTHRSEDTAPFERNASEQDDQLTEPLTNLADTKETQPEHATQPMQPVTRSTRAEQTARIPAAPPPSRSHAPQQPTVPPPQAAMPPPARQAARRRRQKARRSGGLLPPFWSILLMVLVVFAIAVGIIAVFYSMGGNPPTVSEPRILMTPYLIGDSPGTGGSTGDSAPSLLATPTIPPEFDSGVDATPPEFTLQGPTLPAPITSATPEAITIGGTVRVITGVNVRSGPGIDNGVLFVAQNGEIFEVIDGPQQADGLIWWQLRSTGTASRTGWAAENDGEQDLLAPVSSGQ